MWHYNVVVSHPPRRGRAKTQKQASTAKDAQHKLIPGLGVTSDLECT